MSRKKVLKHLKALQKRCDFLDSRIARAEQTGKDLSFDKEERAALVFAISFIEKEISQ